MGRWVTRELAAYATETRFEDYPKEAVAKVRNNPAVGRAECHQNP